MGLSTELPWVLGLGREHVQNKQQAVLAVAGLCYPISSPDVTTESTLLTQAYTFKLCGGLGFSLEQQGSHTGLSLKDRVNGNEEWETIVLQCPG